VSVEEQRTSDCGDEGTTVVVAKHWELKGTNTDAGQARGVIGDKKPNTCTEIWLEG